MPHTVDELRVMEEVRHAYVLLLDGLPIAFTDDASGELTGSGASSYIGRAEDDASETVGGRTILGGLKLPGSIDMGGLSSSIGLDRGDARFSVMLDDTTTPLLVLGGEEPEEMLGRLPPTENPAPATVVGVTVRSRYIGLEYIGSSGERRMFPFIMGESLPGFDHHGDADGAVVPATVSQRPLVHEGRIAALYRVYRDPSATYETNSLAWPSLSNYSPIWVGKMRDAGTIEPGGRITIECTGFESLLERNMGFPTPTTTVLPEVGVVSGVDDQVAIYFGTGNKRLSDGTDGAGDTYQGRDWTTLSGTDRPSIRSALEDLITDTIAGTSTDYETLEDEYDSVMSGDAGFNGDNLYIYKSEGTDTSGDRYWSEMRIAMHRRRWMALGFDPEQQDHPTLGVAKTDNYQIEFTRLTSGAALRPAVNKPLMGTIPGTGYYMGVFTTIALGATSFPEDRSDWDNGGSERHYAPLFPSGDAVRIIQDDGAQVLRLSTDIALLPDPHVPYSGSIDDTDCDAAGYMVLRGKIRTADGSTDDGSLVVDDTRDQVAVARISWVTRDDYFADPVDGSVARVYVEQLHDPRTFGLPFKPLDRDWATLELEGQQLHTFALGTAATKNERADSTLSAFLRSTGTSTGQDGNGVIDQGDNSGSTTGFFGDVFSAALGLGVPSSLLPTQAEITAAFEATTGGINDPLHRQRIAWHDYTPSYDILRSLLEPRGLRVGFDGGAFSLYRLRNASPFDATVAVTESDLHGKQGDPTSVWPTQQSRALPPVDLWRFSYAGQKHEQSARDPGAATRRGDSSVDVLANGLVAPELYADAPNDLPAGGLWRQSARVLFGDQQARFLARRHGKITLKVSRVKGQDIYPGTLALVSNPWPLSGDGTRGLSNVVGRVVKATHNTREASCTVEILVFDTGGQGPAVYAPFLWIESVTNSTTLVRHTSDNLNSDGESSVGWVEPDWSSAGGGNAIATLWRMLPTGAWTEVGTAEVGSVNDTTVALDTALSGLPPDNAYTMLLTLDDHDQQPAWAQALYSAVAEQGDNTDSRRFV